MNLPLSSTVGCAGGCTTPSVTILGNVCFVTANWGNQYSVYNTDDLSLSLTSTAFEKRIVALYSVGELTFVSLEDGRLLACAFGSVVAELCRPTKRSPVTKMVDVAKFTLVSSSDDDLFVWDIGRIFKLVAGRSAGAFDCCDVLAVSPIGESLRSLVNGTVRLMTTVPTYVDQVLVVCEDDSLSLVSLADRSVVPLGLSDSCALDGRILCVAADSPAIDVVALGTSSGSIVLYNIKSRKPLFQLGLLDAPVVALDFHFNKESGRTFLLACTSGNQLVAIDLKARRAVASTSFRVLQASARNLASSLAAAPPVSLRFMSGSAVFVLAGPQGLAVGKIELPNLTPSSQTGKVKGERERGGHSTRAGDHHDDASGDQDDHSALSNGQVSTPSADTVQVSIVRSRLAFEGRISKIVSYRDNDILVGTNMVLSDKVASESESTQTEDDAQFEASNLSVFSQVGKLNMLIAEQNQVWPVKGALTGRKSVEVDDDSEAREQFYALSRWVASAPSVGVPGQSLPFKLLDLAVDEQGVRLFDWPSVVSVYDGLGFAPVYSARQQTLVRRALVPKSTLDAQDPRPYRCDVSFDGSMSVLAMTDSSLQFFLLQSCRWIGSTRRVVLTTQENEVYSLPVSVQFFPQTSKRVILVMPTGIYISNTARKIRRASDPAEPMPVETFSVSSLHLGQHVRITAASRVSSTLITVGLSCGDVLVLEPVRGTVVRRFLGAFENGTSLQLCLSNISPRLLLVGGVLNGTKQGKSTSPQSGIKVFDMLSGLEVCSHGLGLGESVLALDFSKDNSKILVSVDERSVMVNGLADSVPENAIRSHSTPGHLKVFQNSAVFRVERSKVKSDRGSMKRQLVSNGELSMPASSSTITGSANSSCAFSGSFVRGLSGKMIAFERVVSRNELQPIFESRGSVEAVSSTNATGAEAAGGSASALSPRQAKRSKSSTNRVEVSGNSTDGMSTTQNRDISSGLLMSLSSSEANGLVASWYAADVVRALRILAVWLESGKCVDIALAYVKILLRYHQEVILEQCGDPETGPTVRNLLARVSEECGNVSSQVFESTSSISSMGRLAMAL